MDQRLLHYYRGNRRHQLETWGNSNLYVDGRDLRQFTGGGACYGEHALCAYRSARRHINFMERLSADLKESRRRSAAAKRGWKKRRAA
jgi:hypothetical protein